MTVRIFLRLSALTLLSLAGGCISDPEPVSLVEVGSPLPAFSVTLSDGTTLSSTSLAGRPSMIVFFNTGCDDCRRELPVVQRFYDSGPDISIICISREESAADIAAYWEANSLTLPWAASDRSIYSLFATSGIPRIYMADSSRTVRYIWSYDPLPTLDDLLSASRALSSAP